MWKFLVKKQSIEIVEREILADHQIQYVQFKFTFDGDWKHFHKVVQFSQCDEVYTAVLGVSGTSCYLPAELHAGAAKMSVFGYDTESDTTVRATTVPVTLNIRASGFEGDDPPIPPTPDLYTQLLKRIENAEHGLDGKSAYEIAVEHGYIGSETEWLVSLKGADGVDGRNGQNGRDGADGKDGVDGRNGTDGKDGKDGRNGSDGLNGADGKDGRDGASGSDGKSAYNIAVEHGFSGTEAEWLESLKAGVDLTPYATNQRLNEQILLVREAIAPLEQKAHEHHNYAVLSTLTTELLSDLQGLQQFEDGTNHEIHSLNEAVDELKIAKHKHNNKVVLDMITAEMLEDYQSLSDAVSTLKNQSDHNAALIGVNATDITAIHTILTDLQHQIDRLKNSGYTVLFNYGTDAINLYADDIGIVLNGGYHPMREFRQQYSHFCSSDKDFALYYGQEDFNWNAPVLTVVERKLNLTADSRIQFCYNSGFSQDGEMYLVAPPGGKIDVPITLYAKGEIDSGRAFRLPFEWLQSQNFITTETVCSGISPGQYYLAWIGRSDNTRPMIRSVKVLEETI